MQLSRRSMNGFYTEQKDIIGNTQLNIAYDKRRIGTAFRYFEDGRKDTISWGTQQDWITIIGIPGIDISIPEGEN